MNELPAPLLSFMLYHRSMRDGARRLARALADPSAVDGLAQTAAWFDHYRRACLVHAEGEDKVLWPALVEVRDDLSDLLTMMEADHEELDRVLDELAATLSDPDRVGASRAMADRLVVVIEHHLVHEEENAVPALVDALGADLGELMRRVQQHAGPDGAAVAVPFLLASATDKERALVLGGMPPPVRTAFETTWRDAYDALWRPVPG